MVTVLRGIGGLLTGSGLLFTYRCMGSVAQGHTDFIAIKQSSLVYEASFSAFSLLKDMHISERPKWQRMWIARVIAYPLPFALQMLNHRIDGKEYPLAKRVVLYLREHVEHAAFATDIIASVLFTYYVAPYYGVGILIGLSIEVIVEHKLLPKRVQDIWERAWIVIAFTRLFNVLLIDDVDVWDVAKFVGEVSFLAWDQYFEAVCQSPATVHSMNVEQAKQWVEKPLDQFKIDWDHLYNNPRFEIPGANSIDIVSKMEELVNKVDWSKDLLRDFKNRMLRDPRFIALEPEKTSIQDIEDDFAKEYFRRGALSEATQIAFGSFEKGDAYIDFILLRSMLKSILKSISATLETGSEEERLDAIYDLFSLSLEGGEYCANGHVAAIEALYKKRILTGGGDIPLQVKCLQLLIAKRQSWFDALFYIFAKLANKLPQGIIDPADLHLRNVAMFYFDKGFKLHSETVKNDLTTLEGVFCSRLYRFFFSKLLDHTFWLYALSSPSFYSADALIGEMEAISAKDFTQYWVSLARNTKQESIIDEITLSGSIFGKALQVETKNGSLQLNPDLVKLMLCEMGILTT